MSSKIFPYKITEYIDQLGKEDAANGETDRNMDK